MSLACTGVSLSYAQVDVLEDVDLRVDAGESVALMGPSGTGKSSLLNVLTGLLRPRTGSVTIDGCPMTGSDARRAELRRRRIGLLFQSAELLEELSVLDNVAMPQIFAGTPKSSARQAASAALESVGLAELGNRRIDEISGGQAQRVAVARALAKPAVAALVADEPTASLDQRTADDVTHLMLELAHARGAAVLIATHDERVARLCDRTVWLPDINRVVAC